MAENNKTSTTNRNKEIAKNKVTASNTNASNTTTKSKAPTSSKTSAAKKFVTHYADKTMRTGPLAPLYVMARKKLADRKKASQNSSSK